jgi:MbtH protein
MTNPFEDEGARFHVLINAEGQYSIWPTFVDVPQGWRVVLEFRSRSDCVSYVDEHWADMRPTSLISTSLPDN